MAGSYSSYRASGMPWAQRIPEHWESAHLRYVANISNGTTPSRDRADFWENGTIPWLASGQVNDYIVRQAREFITPTAQKVASLRMLPKGSVIVGLYGQGKTRGTSAYLNIDATINQALAGLMPSEKLEGRFLHYVLIAGREYLRNEGRGGSQPNLNCDMVGNFSIPLPPLPEQEKIAHYLRAQDAKIARFIRIKRELIETLNEQKLAVIDHAVTQGLNPDAPRKPSGVAWLGEVPGHWEVLHMGSAVAIVNGYPFDSALFDTEKGHPLVRIRDLTKTNTEIKFNGAEISEAIIETGDLIVGMDGDFNAALWRGERALLNQRMCCLRPKMTITTEYLACVIPKALKFINDFTLATTVKHLSSGDLKRLRFPVPPLEEQHAILAHIKANTEPLTTAIHQAEQEISLFREYRERLIVDAVTGQIDLRGWQASPEECADDAGLLELTDGEIADDDDA